MRNAFVILSILSIDCWVKIGLQIYPVFQLEPINRTYTYNLA